MRISDWSSDVCSSDLEQKPLDIDARKMNRIGIEASGRDDLFHLDDAYPARGRHRLIEVARGLAEQKIACLVRLPRLDQRDVAAKRLFHDIGDAAKFPQFLAFGRLGADAAPGKEGRNTRPACSATLCKRTLRAEFEFEFAGEILALELLVLADVGGEERKSVV